MSEVAAFNPAGDVVTIDSSEAEKAFAGGYRPATPEDVAHAQARAAVAGPMGAIGAAGAGAASLLSFGASDYALPKVVSALGGDEELARQRLGALYEEHPYAKAAGELGTLAIPWGAAGKAGRALGAVPEAIGGLGRLAETGASKLVGEGATSILGRAGQAAARTAARGAVEAGAFGAQQAVSESAITDDFDYLGEKLYGSIGHNLLAGAVLGGALGATLGAGEGVAAKWLGRGRVADVDAVVGAEGAGSALATEQRHAAALRGATEGLDNGAAQTAVAAGHEAAAGTAAQFDKTADAYIRRQFKTPAEAEAASLAYRQRGGVLAHQEGVLDTEARKVAAEGTEVEKSLERLTDISQGAAKPRQVEKLTESADITALVKGPLTEAWQQTEAKLAPYLEKETRRIAPGPIGRIENHFKKFTTDFEKAAAAGDIAPHDLFMSIDNLKKSIGREAGMGLRDFQRSDFQREMFNLYHELIPQLESDAWGGMGAAQKEINAATTTFLGTHDTLRKAFIHREGSVAGNATHEFDPGLVKGYLSGITGAGADIRKRALGDYIANARKRFDAVEKHYELSPADKAQFATGRAALKRLESTLAESERQATAIAKVREIQAAEHHAHVGGLAGFVTDVAMRPLKTVERLASVRRMAAKFDEKMASAVDRVMNGKAPKAERAADRTGLFRERVRRVAEAAGNPDVHAAQVARSMGDLAEAAPKTAAGLSAASLRAIAFLSAKIPPERVGASVFARHEDIWHRSDADEEAFNHYYDYSDKPEKAVHDMTPAAVETLKAVYPKTYAELQSQMLTALSQAEKYIPMQKRMKLALLLDIPADPLLEPAAQATLAQARQTSAPKAAQHGPAQQAAPRRPIRTDDILTTGLQKLALKHP